jgi:hypothetical protein
MMHKYTLIVDDEGRIQQKACLNGYAIPEGQIEISSEEYDTLNLTSMYLLEGSIVERPLQLSVLDKISMVANGIDTLQISNAPKGVFMAVNAETLESVVGVINGTDTFTTTIPGTYKIKIVSWPYLDFETTIEAT